jgi:predicted DNA binding CopG/RHH family protein
MKVHSTAKRRTPQKSAPTASVESAGRAGQRSSPIARRKPGLSASAGRSAKKLPTSVEEFDRRFDEGEDLENLGIDLSKAARTGLQTRRVNVDMPAHFINRLDHWAAVRGLSRQALIKSWVYDRLEQESKA